MGVFCNAQPWVILSSKQSNCGNNPNCFIWQKEEIRTKKMMGQGGNREEEKDAVNFTKIQAAA